MGVTQKNILNSHLTNGGCQSFNSQRWLSHIFPFVCHSAAGHRCRHPAVLQDDTDNTEPIAHDMKRFSRYIPWTEISEWFTLMMSGAFIALGFALSFSDTLTDLFEDSAVWQTAAAVSLGFGASYFLGELLQVFGKYIGKLLWKIDGGDPFLWIFSLNADKATGKYFLAESRLEQYLRQDTLHYVQHYFISELCKEEGNEAGDDFNLDDYLKPEPKLQKQFSAHLRTALFRLMQQSEIRVEAEAYMDNDCRENCRRLLRRSAKYLNFATLALVSLVFPLLRIVREETLPPESDSPIWYFIALCAMSGMAWLFAHQYKENTIKHFCCLFEGFFRVKSKRRKKIVISHSPKNIFPIKFQAPEHTAIVHAFDTAAVRLAESRTWQSLPPEACTDLELTPQDEREESTGEEAC